MAEPWYYIDETELDAEEFERLLSRVRSWRVKSVDEVRIGDAVYGSYKPLSTPEDLIKFGELKEKVKRLTMRTLRIVWMEVTAEGKIVWDDTGEEAEDIVLLCINPLAPTSEITGYVTFIKDHLVTRGEKLDITVRPELVRIVFGAK